MFNYKKLTLDNSVANVVNLIFTGGTKATYTARFVDQQNKTVATPSGVEISLTKSVGTCEIEITSEAESDFSNVAGLRVTYYGESVASQTIPFELIKSGFAPSSLIVDKSGGEFNITLGVDYQPTWEGLEISNGSIISSSINTCSRDITLKIDPSEVDRTISLTVAYDNTSKTLDVKQIAKEKPEITVSPTSWNATTSSSTTQKFIIDGEIDNYFLYNLPSFVKNISKEAKEFTLEAKRRPSKRDYKTSFNITVDSSGFTIDLPVEVFQEGCYVEAPVTNIIAKADQEEIAIPWIAHNILPSDCTADNTDWVKEIDYQTDKLKLTLSKNTGDLRKQNFDVVITVENQVIQTIHLLVVQLSENQSDIPIWKDVEYNETSGDWIEYHIDDVENNVLYAGKAYPVDNQIKFYVNQVVYNYLTDFPLEDRIFTPAGDYSKIFYLKTSTGNISVYNFKNDWSYKENSLYINSPTNIIDPRAYFIISGDYNYRFDIAGTNYTFDSIGTYKIDLNSLSIPCGEKIKVYFKDELIKEYVIASSNYILYYTNSTGAWNFISIKGNTIKTDNITSSSFERRPIRPSNSFGVVKYQNIIKPSWSLNTGWIKGNIADLIESLNIYLFDLTTREFIPVNITDSSTEYKDYTNNGKHLVNYTINIEASQTNERH